MCVGGIKAPGSGGGGKGAWQSGGVKVPGSGGGKSAWQSGRKKLGMIQAGWAKDYMPAYSLQLLTYSFWPIGGGSRL